MERDIQLVRVVSGSELAEALPGDGHVVDAVADQLLVDLPLKVDGALAMFSAEGIGETLETPLPTEKGIGESHGVDEEPSKRWRVPPFLLSSLFRWLSVGHSELYERRRPGHLLHQHPRSCRIVGQFQRESATHPGVSTSCGVMADRDPGEVEEQVVANHGRRYINGSCEEDLFDPFVDLVDFPALIPGDLFEQVRFPAGDSFGAVEEALSPQFGLPIQLPCTKPELLHMIDSCLRVEHEDPLRWANRFVRKPKPLLGSGSLAGSRGTAPDRHF